MLIFPLNAGLKAKKVEVPVFLGVRAVQWRDDLLRQTSAIL